MKLPQPNQVEELETFLRGLDMPEPGQRHYLDTHFARIVRTLSVTPPPAETSRVLELGAYMHMTPALSYVLGYHEVRGAYFGKLGHTDRRVVTAGGKQIFECWLDQFDAEKDRFPYRDSYFDTVLACEIFEHFLHDPMHMLIECRRVLTSNGKLVLTTPNVASYTAVARVLERGGNPQLFSKYADPRGKYADTEVPHVREYTPGEIEEVLKSAGFEIDYLFTEIAPGYHAEDWVRDFLLAHNYPTDLRGEQMYCVAHCKTDAEITRFPDFLYEV